MPRACLATALALLAFAVLDPAPAVSQANYDRPGGDYQRTAVPSGDPAVCALQCERDRRCRAWSFGYPTGDVSSAVCWLKNTVPARVESSSNVSGVRGAGVIEQRNSNIEMFTDRFGGDYRNFDTKPDANGAACKAACDQDDKCRAWTYARPGYAGANARCFLKSQVKPPRRRPGLVSGVVR